MEWQYNNQKRRARRMAAALLGAVLGISACSGGDDTTDQGSSFAAGGVLSVAGAAGIIASPMVGVGGMVLTSAGGAAGSNPALGGAAGTLTSAGGMGAGGTGAGGMSEIGVGGMPDAGSGEGMVPDAMPPEPEREDLGEGDGRDVITIGDSWMSLIATGIQQSLVANSGRPYRTYGVPGTRLLNEQIPGQYANAKRADPDIITVVMTGGGNDIIQVPGLREDCDAGGSLCETEVGKILDRLSALWAEMAEDGVQDVIYVQYSTPEGTDVDFELPSGDNVVKRCDNVPEPLRCHRLETNAIVMRDIPDGIHPSAAGYDRIADAVYDMMVEKGMRR